MANRRYSPIGKQPIYDRIYDRLRFDSPILNPKGKPNAYSFSMGDKRTLMSLLVERKGAEGMDGFLYKGETGEKVPSRLTAAEAGLQAIKDQFAKLRQQAVNMGRKPPKTMPQDMQEKKLRAEAKLDIIRDEIDELEKRLASFTGKEDTTSDRDVLYYGPQGSGKLRKGVLAVVDGQTVKADSDGVLRIKDSRSPYDGMATADYFEEVVRPFLKTRRGQGPRPIKREDLPPRPAEAKKSA